jgi:hypothetical protein
MTCSKNCLLYDELIFPSCISYLNKFDISSDLGKEFSLRLIYFLSQEIKVTTTTLDVTVYPWKATTPDVIVCPWKAGKQFLQGGQKNMGTSMPAEQLNTHPL